MHADAIEAIEQCLFPVEYRNRQSCERSSDILETINMLFAVAARQAERRQWCWRTGQPGAITQFGQTGPYTGKQRVTPAKQGQTALHLEQELARRVET